MITIKKDTLNEYFEAGKQMREFYDAHLHAILAGEYKDECDKLFKKYDTRIREDLGGLNLYLSTAICAIIDLRWAEGSNVSEEAAINAIKALGVVIEGE